MLAQGVDLSQYLGVVVAGGLAIVTLTVFIWAETRVRTEVGAEGIMVRTYTKSLRLPWDEGVVEIHKDIDSPLL